MRHSPDSRVRVLQVSGALYFGGAEKVIAALAREVDRTRFEMEVCCTHALGPLADAITADGVPVTLAKSSGRSSYLRPLDVREVIARFKPHVVHSHGLPALSTIGPLAMFGYVPFWVHTFHYGNYPYAQRRYMWMERVYGRWADRLVAVAEPQRQAILRHHGYSPDRIVTLLNGVPANPFVNDPDVRARKRRELDIPENDPVVGTVAVLTEQKGIDYLIDAASLVSARYPRVRFLVVGDGPLMGALRARAAAIGLDSRITFTGWRADVTELLAAMDIYVMSSLWEAMPLALLEAMAAARPIVVTDVGDNRRIVADGKAASVVAARDASAIAGAVADLLDNPAQATELGRQAYRTFSAKYALSRMIATYEATYLHADPMVSPVPGEKVSQS
jgi:glycosyltransferase involved in cell wall biosynthesis